MNLFVYGEGDARVTRDRDGRVTGNACACGDCDLERRIRVRMAEAEDAARVGMVRIRHLSSRSADADPTEIERLAQLVQMHERLAEALGAVLEGGF